MKEHTTTVTLMDEMHFDANLENHTISIDADKEFGGQNKGPKPKALLLVSLAGCTGMDVISILRKMRAIPEGFSITVNAKLSEEHPKVYTDIHIIYNVKGDVPREKVERAVTLSQENYCGVSAMLKKAANITYEINIE